MENLVTNNQESCDFPSFVPFFSSLSTSNCQIEEETSLKRYKPSFCLDLKSSFEIDPLFHTDVYAAGLVENGKTLAVFEQDSSGNLNMHKYRFNDNLSSIHAHLCNSWLIRDYDYLINYDASCVVMFNSEELAHERDSRRRRKRGYGLGDKLYISLLVFDLDFENDSEHSRGEFYPNLYKLEFPNKHCSEHVEDMHTSFWKFNHGYAITNDGTVVVSTLGFPSGESKSLHVSVLYLNFFKVERKGVGTVLKHCSQKEIPIPNKFLLKPTDASIVCNRTFTKIFFRSHNIVYNVVTEEILELVEEALENNFWVDDRFYDEVLISLDRPTLTKGYVKIFKENKGTFSLFRTFYTCALLSNNQEPTLYCHGLNNGEIHLFIESHLASKQIMGLNPFSMKVDFLLDIPETFATPYVRKVLVTGHQILVIVSDTEREFVMGYNLQKKDSLQSLKNLAACVTLKNYSLNQIKSFGVPNVLNNFLRNNIFHA